MDFGRSALRYKSVEGFFKQDDPETDPASFNYTLENFGLIERPYDSDASLDHAIRKSQWQRFEHYVKTLNQEDPQQVEYKVLFMGRHGEGDHNVAEAFYGTKAWDEHWSLLPGNGTVNWTDAHLTPKGIDQAKAVNAFWVKEMGEQKIPTPERYYVSPLARCLQTAHYSFTGLDLPADRPFVPTIKELLREVIGEHTCDMRSSKTWIQEHYPDWPIEPGFSESDEMWKPNERETTEEIVARMHRLLEDIFSDDKSTFISFTAHSGAIAALLTALGHRAFRLETGTVIPTLVRIEKARQGGS